MKKLLLLLLFVFGVGVALWNFSPPPGEFESIVLDFREELSPAEIEQSLAAIATQYHHEAILNSPFSKGDRIYILPGDQHQLQALKKTPLLQKTETIEPNYIYHALEVPNDPGYSKQWNLRSIQVETAWDDTKGEGVTVAVIDTGVTQVRDLRQTKFVEGYDFIANRSEVHDDVGHGTHVAGTIAQSTNNSYGVAGIAYEAKIMPIKVLGAGGGGTVADIAEGIRFAVDHGADVINLSLGGFGESQLMAEAINYAYDKGSVIVGAAGNANRNAAAYPARYPHVIGVAALDASAQKASYSNFGAGVDLAAPGGSEQGPILQNTVDSDGEAVFAGHWGTSMAAPHVAGVAALVKAAGVTEPEAVLKVLRQTARQVPEDPLNYYGAGQLDAGAAVALARRGQITVQDFFRWLRDSGYLNPRFWIDGGAVALFPKVVMVVGSYLLAWFLRNYFPFRWSWSLASGLMAGSAGLFFLRGLYIFDLPQWPFRVLGSSIPELGNIVQGSSALNPLFASAFIPFLLIVLLLGHPVGKWFAIGSALGVAACLAVNAVLSPLVWGLGTEGARLFLGINALLCLSLASLASQGGRQTA
ncbi:MAG: S8 family peptidase [Cyanophyceae cyanobacterium]